MHVQHRTLGNTGLLASRLCLDTMTFSSGEDSDKVIGNVDASLMETSAPRQRQGHAPDVRLRTRGLRPCWAIGARRPNLGRVRKSDVRPRRCASVSPFKETSTSGLSSRPVLAGMFVAHSAGARSHGVHRSVGITPSGYRTKRSREKTRPGEGGGEMGGTGSVVGCPYGLLVTSRICCPVPTGGHRQTDRTPFFNQNMTARSRRQR